MYTRCIFSVEVTIHISESWQPGAPIAQITKDAERAARCELDRIMPSAVSAAKVSLKHVELHPNKGDPV